MTDDTVRERFAFFDLDHTILPQDTQALFAQYIFTKQPWRLVYLFWYIPSLIPAALKLIDLRTMKRIFSSYLMGMSDVELQEHACQFVREIVPQVAYPEIVSEIHRLKEEGYTMVLNSASPEFYVREIASHFGFDHYIGTNLIVEKKMPFLPKIIGPNNKHGEKITAMCEKGILPETFDAKYDGRIPGSWAFSDSPADLPLLSIAEHGVTIHPGETLSQAADENGWEKRYPKQPYQGKWGGKLATLRLALGLGRKYLVRTEDLN